VQPQEGPTDVGETHEEMHSPEMSRDWRDYNINAGGDTSLPSNDVMVDDEEEFEEEEFYSDEEGFPENFDDIDQDFRR
jgi:hypothetical protein